MVVLLAAMFVGGCAESAVEGLAGRGRDAGRSRVPDAESSRVDAGGVDTGSADGAEARPDTGPVEPDAGPTALDATCSAESAATTYQINAAHDGEQPCDTVRLPLEPRWSRNVGGEMSYPVAADGRVFVAVRLREQSSYGATILALSAEDGSTLWGPIRLDGPYWWAGLAYGEGRVVASGFDGPLTAFDAASGAVLWTAPIGVLLSSEPTVFDGRVYVSGAGAFDLRTGSLLWRMLTSSDHSAPALSEEGVFVSFACNYAQSFDRITGMQRWIHSESCSGGGGRTVALRAGRVYTRDFFGNRLLDSATGAVVGEHPATLIPSFSDGVGYFAHPQGLIARDESTGVVRWSFPSNEITAAPIVVGPHVIVGTQSHLLVLDKSTGAQLGSSRVPVSGPDEHNVAVPVAGLSAAGGRLFVPSGDALIAF